MIGIAGNDHARAALVLTATDGWIHKIKHDGFRLQIHVRGSWACLSTMTGVGLDGALSRSPGGDALRSPGNRNMVPRD